MGNNPVSGFDPDGGWSWLGAQLRRGLSWTRGEKPSAIYKKDGEYGFNFTPKNVETDAGGIATVYAGSSFGPNRRAQEVTNSLPQTAFLNRSTGNYDYAKASGKIDPVYIEFDAALTAYTGGQYLLARQAARAGGTFYRAMSTAEYAALESNEGLTYMAGKELFVSSKASYSRAYLQKSGYDVLVQFNMKPGAKSFFNKVGVMHRTPEAARGWASRGNLLWKSEHGVMNLGIQQNTHMFNPWIQSFKTIP